jgi:predicted phosphohydrolase
MKIFAISDLHLSLRDGRLYKPMDRFGAGWRDHHLKIQDDWHERVDSEDLVLVPGDISWAGKPAEALEDLEWLGRLPGRKVLVKGNHDWWLPSSRKKAQELLPDSVTVIRNDAALVGDVLLFGSRLWNVPGLEFPMDVIENDEPLVPGRDSEKDAKILQREFERLKLSIEVARTIAENNAVRTRICLTHFPPTDFNGAATEATRLLAGFETDACVFGHVHGLPQGHKSVDVGGVRYYLTSCDYLNFKLLSVA